MRRSPLGATMKNAVVNTLVRFAGWYASCFIPPHYDRDGTYSEEELLHMTYRSHWGYWF